MIVKAEVYMDKAYILDEWGNLYRVVADPLTGIQFSLIRRDINVNDICKPSLARFDPELH